MLDPISLGWRKKFVATCCAVVDADERIVKWDMPSI